MVRGVEGTLLTPCIPFEEVQCAGRIADERDPAVRHEDDLLEHCEEFASGLVDGAHHCLAAQRHRLQSLWEHGRWSSTY